MDWPLCADDLVTKASNEYHVGTVDRTHADVDTHIPYPGREDDYTGTIKRDNDISKAAFRKFKKDGIPPAGTVLVSWEHTPNPQLIQESKLTLFDRSLLIGDVVKKNSRDAMSGTVINTFTKCTLQPPSDYEFQPPNHSSRIKLKAAMLPPSVKESRAPCIGDVPASELRYDDSPSPEDLVIWKQWLGRVSHVTYAASLQLSDNCVVEIEENDAERIDGSPDAFGIGDVAVTKKGTLRTGRWIYGKYNPNTAPFGTIVHMRITSVRVGWLEQRMGTEDDDDVSEPDILLERFEVEEGDFHVYDRTRRPKAATPASDTVSNSEIDVRLGLRVRFNDLSGACVKYDGTGGRSKLNRIDRKETNGFDMNVFDVVKLQTDVTVQWQDLSITRERSIDLIPDVVIDDEHDTWPGEIVHSLDLVPIPGVSHMRQVRKTGIVQTVDASARMLKVRWCPEAELKYSVDDSDASGSRLLLGRKVGVATGETEDLSLYDVEAPGDLNVRRGDICLVDPVDWSPDQTEHDQEVDWVGEIVDVGQDGLLTIRLGASTEVKDVKYRREEVVVAVRSDDTGAELDFVSPFSDGPDDPLAGIDFDSEGNVVLREFEESDEDYWTEASSDDPHSMWRTVDENGQPVSDSDEWESEVEEEDDDGDVEMADAHEPTPLTSQSATPPEREKEEEVLDDAAAGPIPDGPEQYTILSTPVPADQHFANKPTTETPKHIKRTQKEHKILQSPGVLPSGVYVRTWESRLDLLRVLFVGPAETPYADAPFVIDFYLPDSFPIEPPQAFFYSWSVDNNLGGVGRVNPNLYEDGKICLSLLGTWESGKTESWNAERSTLLQVIVSLLGLVLVREPYFNEAGYEHLAGLESSKRSSELYNERTYVKARTFIISALKGAKAVSERTAGVAGLEDVIEWLYNEWSGPKLLEKTTTEIEEVLRKSEGGSGEGLVMSKGACIPLRRVLDKLREL